MARASNRPHLFGWLLLGLLSFLQSPGLTFADTKHDLAASPAHFLRGALHAWTDVFPLGQLQNQAYGYLFPQGLFFLITDFLPDWVAQRLWWTLVLGVGYSGCLLLLRRLSVDTAAWQMLGAMLFALSPHTLSTLGAISSETWPMMVAPWILVPLVGCRPGSREVATSILAVACLGAVNATATAAACLPAFLALVVSRSWRSLSYWLAGCALVSLWWLGPLFVLGRYAPPFPDFIESSYVTTRWLSLPELLRGASSWAPFADSERLAGTALATSPYFVLLTAAVAAMGLAGLSRHPHRRLFAVMLLTGAAVMSSAHGPFGEHVLQFLDGPGAPLRNVHKFDVLVRLPLVVGFVQFASEIRLRDMGRRYAAAALVGVVAAGAMAPAWSGRLGPRGGYEEVPQYWHDAAAWLNQNASDTRTVVLPQSSFARQEWGWTRDEPLQPLLDVPWLVRDAVPLVPPEAIRGIDGLMAHPTADGFARLGVGAAVIRHDLAGPTNSRLLVADFADQGLVVHHFGEVDIVEFDLHRSLHVAQGSTRVAGGGEALALLEPGAYELVDHAATIVTDTPQLTARNYGTVWNAVSAPLAAEEEGADVRNAVRDYPSRGPINRVRSSAVRASSSAADATSFGGANPQRSLTAAFDGSRDTAWYPAPGTGQGEFVELAGPFDNPQLTVVSDGSPVVLTISTEDITVNKVAEPGMPLHVELPTARADHIRITLGASGEPAGLAEVSVAGHHFSRILEVPNMSPDVQKFLFQRVFVDTGRIHRLFTAPRDMTVTVAASSCDEDPATANPTGVTDDFQLDHAPLACGDTINLAAGEHELSTTASWITLTTPEFVPAPPPTPITEVPESSESQLLITGRAFNDGLRATVGGAAVAPQRIDADTQAFLIPPGIHGAVNISFVGDRPYRASLFGGLGLAACTILGCLWWRRRAQPGGDVPPSGTAPRVFGLVVIGVVAGPAGLLGVLLGRLITRYTFFSAPKLAALSMGLAGLWLAHAPWPSASYAGDQWFVTFACVVSLAAACGLADPWPTAPNLTRSMK